MALNEKRLKYKSRIVQLLKCEQYEPSFMYLNPKGQVPVLIDGVKVIPDSARIIDYLEDNFSNGIALYTTLEYSHIKCRCRSVWQIIIVCWHSN